MAGKEEDEIQNEGDGKQKVKHEKSHVDSPKVVLELSAKIVEGRDEIYQRNDGKRHYPPDAEVHF
jgi:hypothetical protein